MNKRTLSLLASSLLATSVFAIDKVAIYEAITNGKTTGEISVFATHSSNGGTTTDSGYTLGSATLNYETKSIEGFKANLGFISTQAWTTSHSNDFEGAPSAILNRANISYDTDEYTIIAGRQSIDLEWVGDAHEAVVGIIKTIPNTDIIVGYTHRQATDINDGALTDFTTIGDHGGALIDATHTYSDGTKINAFIIDAPSVFTALGTKVETKHMDYKIKGQIALTNEDAVNTDNGSVVAIDINYDLNGTKINSGIIKTGSKNGIGHLAELGDNLNPLDSGNKVYGGDGKTTDCTTLYVGAQTMIEAYEVAGMIGTTSYKDTTNNKTARESEINLSVSRGIDKNIATNLLVGNIFGDTSNENSTYIEAQIVYSF